MKKFTQSLIKGLLIIVIATMAFGAQLTLPQKDSQVHSDAPTITLSWGTEAYAENGDTGDKKPATTEEGAVKDPKTIEDFIKSVAKMVTYVHRVLYPLNHYFAFQIGNFLGNDYIFEGDMGTMLKGIWVIMRNIVNVIFVLILLFLAVRYIVSGKDEGGGLRQQLGKFAILLIAVNFSWMVSKVILDAANVATNVVFSIPSGVSSVAGDALLKKCDITRDENNNQITIGLCYPTAIFVAAKDGGEAHYMKTADCEKENLSEKYEKNEKFTDPYSATTFNKAREVTTFCWDTLNLSNFRQQTSTIYLTYGTARIQNLIRTTATDLDDMTVGAFFSLVLQIVYLVTLIALFLALVIRMAVLWIFVAFSPVLVLMYYLSDFKMEGVSQFSIKEFVKWAFLPVGVGAVFSVSFLMIATGQSIAEVNPGFFDTITKYTNFTYKNYTSESLFSGIGSLQQFIWHLITVGILWVGTFSILGKFDYIKPITDTIDKAGRGAAYKVGTAPYWAPIIPLYDPKTGKFIGRTSLKAEMDKYGERIERYTGGPPSNVRSILSKISNKSTKKMDNVEKKNANEIASHYGNLDIKVALANENDFKQAFREKGHTESEINHIFKVFRESTQKQTPAQRAPALGPSTAEAAAAAETQRKSEEAVKRGENKSPEEKEKKEEEK